MPSQDETPSPRAAATPAPPSLLGAPASNATPAPGVRMLDAIGGGVRAEPARGGRGAWAWLAGALLLAVVAAVALLGRRESVPAMPTGMPVTTAASVASAAAAASSAEPATTARIEAPADAPPAAPASAPPVVAAAAAPVTPSAARPAVRVAKAASAPAAAASRTRVASRQKADPLGAPASRVARDGAGTDADVDLIAALLARMGHAPAPTAGAGALDAPTIAQLVQRCEANPPAEARSCRQRICDGYWGKAEACPMRLAPAKKG